MSLRVQPDPRVKDKDCSKTILVFECKRPDVFRHSGQAPASLLDLLVLADWLQPEGVPKNVMLQMAAL